MTHDELERTPRNLPVRDISVRVEGRPGHLVAEVSSPDFAGQDEAVRQQQVWEHLVNTLTDDERVEVELVFTSTPKEARHALEGASGSS